MSLGRVPSDASADALAALFARAARNLERIIRRAIRDERVAEVEYRRRQHHAIVAAIARLRREQRLPARRAVRQAWDSGVAAAADLAPGGVQLGFGGGVNEDALRRIAREFDGSLSDALGTVGRRADDALRRAGLLRAAEGIGSGSSRVEVSRAIERDLIHEGLTAYVDKAGRRWRLDTYARMVARTTTREAVVQGTAASLLARGSRLVTISSHQHPHDVCSPWDGKTVAIPGERVEGYETIPELPPFHPNCRHVVTPATATLDEFERALRAGARRAGAARAA